MNRFYKIFIALILLTFTFSCAEDYLEVVNENVLSENSFYLTEKDFEDLTITAYTPLAFHNLFAREMQSFGFAIDDRILHERQDWDQLQYNSTSENIANIYDGLYVGLYRCNLFFEVLNDEINFTDPARRETMKGEIYFLRGLYMFYLGDWFEVGPFLTETAKDVLDGIPNGTQEQFYDQAEADFQAAIDLLPDAWSDAQLGRVTKNAAKAFLGKTYLYRAKFSEAADIFAEVINSGMYSLNMPQGTDSIDFVNAYLSNFTSMDMPGSADNVYKSEFNSESIFEINFSTEVDNGTARASQYLPGRRSTGSQITWFNGPSVITQGYGNLAMEQAKFEGEFEKPANHPSGLEYDPRYYAIYMRPGDPIDFREGFEYTGQPFKESYINSTLPTDLGMRKNLFPYHTTQVHSNAPFGDPNNWRLMRYADVLLMYTEAAFRSGNSPAADPVDALNEVRARAGLEPVGTLTRNAIIHERDIELAAEHARFWDLGRWLNDGWIDLAYINQTLPTYEDRHVCFPLPTRDLDRHYGVLKQNPKWE